MTKVIRLSLVLTMVSVLGQRSRGQEDRSTKAPLVILISTRDSAIKTGSDVVVNLTVTNASQQPVDASGCYCGPSRLDTIVKWEVHDNGNSTAKKTYPHPELAGGSAILDRIIKPGESISESQDIGRLYDFEKPGKYIIRASRTLPKELGGGTVQSNEITVTVSE